MTSDVIRTPVSGVRSRKKPSSRRPAGVSACGASVQNQGAPPDRLAAGERTRPRSCAPCSPYGAARKIALQRFAENRWPFGTKSFKRIGNLYNTPKSCFDLDQRDSRGGTKRGRHRPKDLSGPGCRCAERAWSADEDAAGARARRWVPLLREGRDRLCVRGRCGAKSRKGPNGPLRRQGKEPL